MISDASHIALGGGSRCVSGDTIIDGQSLTIKELAEIIKKIVGYKGKINFDHTKADGSFRKLLDSKRLNKIGFNFKTSLKDGLIETYKDFIKHHENN